METETKAQNVICHDCDFVRGMDSHGQFIVKGIKFCPLHAAAAELLKACWAAYHALRSYQYGNAAADLAQYVADDCLKAIDKAEERMP